MILYLELLMVVKDQATYEDTGRQLEGWRKQAQEMADKMKKNERKGN